MVSFCSFVLGLQIHFGHENVLGMYVAGINFDINYSG